MKNILSLVLAVVCSATLLSAGPAEDKIVAMERRAMDGWLSGSPDELLALLHPEVTYFHSTIEKRIEGLDAVKAVFEGYRGRPLFDRYDMADPKVVLSGPTAVLTYYLTTENGSLIRRWHATEVYQDGQSGWRIVHSHFSLIQP